MTISDAPPTPAICVSVDDAAFMANLLNPVTEQLISLQTSDCEQPLDAHLDAVVAQHGQVFLECRHIGERCVPHGPNWTVPLADVLPPHLVTTAHTFSHVFPNDANCPPPSGTPTDA